MKIIQIGTCVGNDDLTKIIESHKHDLLNGQPDLLVLVEPMNIHNDKILECYNSIQNKHLENLAVSEKSDGDISFFYHLDDAPNYEVSSNNFNHVAKHYFNSKDKIVEIKVKCININDLFDKYNLTDIDILFIDAEGFDDMIIKTIDFNKFKIREIYFENLHLTQFDIYFYLESLGYTITPRVGLNGWTSLAKKI
jgi:FkbM family methyltransferase